MITIQTSHKTLENFFLGLSSAIFADIRRSVALSSNDRMQAMKQVLAGTKFTEFLFPPNPFQIGNPI